MTGARKDPEADIYQLLLQTSKKKGKITRKELLDALNVKEFFESGTISIDKKTCQGLECELCIKACPTNALYWRHGEIGIVKELCVFCGACVLCCIVDDCVKITRKRSDGRTEVFSKPSEVPVLFRCINSRKRHERAKSVFPDSESYLRRFRKSER